MKLRRKKWQWGMMKTKRKRLKIGEVRRMKRWWRIRRQMTAKYKLILCLLYVKGVSEKIEKKCKGMHKCHQLGEGCLQALQNNETDTDEGEKPSTSWKWLYTKFETGWTLKKHISEYKQAVKRFDDILSSTLFNIYVNDVIAALESTDVEVPITQNRATLCRQCCTSG